MSPDAPWMERAVFYGLHLHNSWLLLPAVSVASFVLLLLLLRANAVRASAYRSFLLSFGVLPFVIYSTKDVGAMLARASHGFVPTLKYAYLVLGLPTLALFLLAALALAFDGQTTATGGSKARLWKVVAVMFICALTLFQSLWMFEADASL